VTIGMPPSLVLRLLLLLLPGGDGPKRRLLEQMVVTHGLEGRVTLVGAVPHDKAREFLVRRAALRCAVSQPCFLSGIAYNLCPHILAYLCPAPARPHLSLPDRYLAVPLLTSSHPGSPPALAAPGPHLCQCQPDGGVLHGHCGGSSGGAAGGVHLCGGRAGGEGL
jgi:hypothetical protein